MAVFYIIIFRFKTMFMIDLSNIKSGTEIETHDLYKFYNRNYSVILATLQITSYALGV